MKHSDKVVSSLDIADDLKILCDNKVHYIGFFF